MAQGVAGGRVRILHRNEDYDGAVNRAYYAMFSAARALLAAHGSAAADFKTHGAIVRAFSERFVRNGMFGPEHGRAIRLAGEARNIADYKAEALTAQRTSDLLAMMDSFLSMAGTMLEPEEEA